MKILGVDFAPLHLPLRRRLQTLAVLFWVACFLVTGLGGLILFTSLTFSGFAFIPVLYLLWMVFDRKTCRQGGRRFQWVRKLPVWKQFRNYFPVHLVKTADLDPNKNYIFGYHPHGIFGIGALCNFATEATNFSGVYPGIKPSVLTLKINFKFPIYRDYLMALGLCSVSRKSIEYILTRQGKGNAAIIVVGGAAEALDAHPNRPIVLTLKRRKGFVRMAIRYGASLVPIFSFGENDLYSQAPNPEGSIMRIFQNKFKSIFGFVPVLIKGRGIFQYNFGYMPYRCPITTVVGKPIEVEHIPNPTDEDINKYHTKYIESLQELFEEYKDKCGDEYKNITLKIC